MISNGFPLENLHIVGHSLGAQLGSQVGQGIIRDTNGAKKLKRLTGLDPAFPGFYPNTFTKAISSNDAEFVDIIYTDSSPQVFGTPFKTGHADFVPNAELFRVQPGCPARIFLDLMALTNFCSHHRSVRFFAESVTAVSGNKFLARKCGSWDDFKRNKCNSNEIVTFGIDAIP
jgi:pancreatic triacylglycerol lipase